MMEYWDKVWSSESSEQLSGYLSRYNNLNNEIVNLFSKYEVCDICDAACGFGAYSLLFSSNGFKVQGFDISSESIATTKKLLEPYGIDTSGYIQSDITDIKFESDKFDAAVAHAVIDHLTLENAKKALSQLKRIVKNNGLIYISFDPIEDEDLAVAHDILEDGSLLYTDSSRKGMIFRRYTDSMICEELLNGVDLIYFKTDVRGNRNVVYKNIK